MADRIAEWRLFIAVATAGSFAEAARREGRSPQAVTRAVAALEARIGTRLLHRTTRSVSLTGDGERFLERSRRVVAEVEQLEATGRPALRGPLAVTAPVLFGQLRVLPIVAGFLRAHPDVDVRLSLLDRVVALAEEGIDVGIRIGELPDSSLRALVVGRVRQVVVASPAYLERAGVPESLDDLAGHDCIGFSTESPVVTRWSFPGPKRERSIAVRTRLTVNTTRAAIDAALAGLGLTRVLSYGIDPLVAEKKLRIVLADFEPEPRPVQLVHLPGVQTPAAAAFVDFAAKALRQSLGGRR